MFAMMVILIFVFNMETHELILGRTNYAVDIFVIIRIRSILYVKYTHISQNLITTQENNVEYYPKIN